jgi:hypothetical protein
LSTIAEQIVFTEAKQRSRTNKHRERLFLRAELDKMRLLAQNVKSFGDKVYYLHYAISSDDLLPSAESSEDGEGKIVSFN